MMKMTKTKIRAPRRSLMEEAQEFEVAIRKAKNEARRRSWLPPFSNTRLTAR